MTFSKSNVPSVIAIGSLLALGAALAGPALAQDSAAEKAALAQCAKDICGMVVGKDKTGPDLSCDLTKTWAGDEIEKGAKAKSVPWGFGRTACSVKVAIKRADIVAAMTSPEFTLKPDKHTISCELERGSEKYPVKASIAPELQLKDGKVIHASMHFSGIEGASVIKGAVWTAAKLEENLGLFEGDLVKEVNKFVAKECPKQLANAK